MNYVKIKKPELFKPLQPWLPALNGFDVDWYLSDERTLKELSIFRNKYGLREYLKQFYKEHTADEVVDPDYAKVYAKEDKMIFNKKVSIDEWYDFHCATSYRSEEIEVVITQAKEWLDLLKNGQILYLSLGGAPFDLVREDFLAIVDILVVNPEHLDEDLATLQLKDGTNIEVLTDGKDVIHLPCLIEEIIASELLQNLKGAHEALVENIERYLEFKEEEELEWMRMTPVEREHAKLTFRSPYLGRRFPAPQQP